jgi:hypothetical protein
MVVRARALVDGEHFTFSGSFILADPFSSSFRCPRGSRGRGRIASKDRTNEVTKICNVKNCTTAANQPPLFHPLHRFFLSISDIWRIPIPSLCASSYRPRLRIHHTKPPTAITRRRTTIISSIVFASTHRTAPYGYKDRVALPYVDHSTRRVKSVKPLRLS